MLVIIPVAYLTLSGWLDNYAYSIKLTWIWFVLAGFIVLITAFLATVSHSIKISRINPAKILRSE